MTNPCPSCGSDNRRQSRFCQQCGKPLSSQPGPLAPPAQARWWRLRGGLLILLCVGLLAWWGMARLLSVGRAAPGAIGVNTPVACATATRAVPAAAPTAAPLRIPGLNIEIPHLSDAEEIEIGQEVARAVEAEFGVWHDAAAQQRVAAIGQRIVPASDRPALTYHFTILDTDEVNAFAVPGGFIFVTRGMLEFVNPVPDDELASVIGHEIAHVARRHAAKRIERVTLAIAALEAVVHRNQDWERIYETQAAQIIKDTTGELLVSGWGRNQEFDADHYGVLYMQQAGYDPNAAITLFLRMQSAFPPDSTGPAERMLATHPPFPDRIERLETVISENP